MDREDQEIEEQPSIEEIIIEFYEYIEGKYPNTLSDDVLWSLLGSAAGISVSEEETLDEFLARATLMFHKTKRAIVKNSANKALQEMFCSAVAETVKTNSDPN